MATTLSSTQRILSEDVLTITEARSELFQLTGKRPDKSTMGRWIHRGVGRPRVRLEAIRLGHANLYTSRQALTRFIEARTAQTIG
ncbi:MAG: DUF1580 domain-containing protein [Planctomycetota bacterium]